MKYVVMVIDTEGHWNRDTLSYELPPTPAQLCADVSMLLSAARAICGHDGFNHVIVIECDGETFNEYSKTRLYVNRKNLNFVRADLGVSKLAECMMRADTGIGAWVYQNRTKGAPTRHFYWGACSNADFALARYAGAGSNDPHSLKITERGPLGTVKIKTYGEIMAAIEAVNSNVTIDRDGVARPLQPKYGPPMLAAPGNLATLKAILNPPEKFIAGQGFLPIPKRAQRPDLRDLQVAFHHYERMMQRFAHRWCDGQLPPGHWTNFKKFLALCSRWNRIAWELGAVLPMADDETRAWGLPGWAGESQEFEPIPPVAVPHPNPNKLNQHGERLMRVLRRLALLHRYGVEKIMPSLGYKLTWILKDPRDQDNVLGKGLKLKLTDPHEIQKIYWQRAVWQNPTVQTSPEISEMKDCYEFYRFLAPMRNDDDLSEDVRGLPDIDKKKRKARARKVFEVWNIFTAWIFDIQSAVCQLAFLLPLATIEKPEKWRAVKAKRFADVPPGADNRDWEWEMTVDHIYLEPFQPYPRTPNYCTEDDDDDDNHGKPPLIPIPIPFKDPEMPEDRRREQPGPPVEPPVTGYDWERIREAIREGIRRYLEKKMKEPMEDPWFPPELPEPIEPPAPIRIPEVPTAPPVEIPGIGPVPDVPELIKKDPEIIAKWVEETEEWLKLAERAVKYVPK